MLKKLNKRYIFSAIHGFFLYLSLIFCSFIAGWNMRDIVLERYVQGFWNNQLYARVNFLYSLFIFFSLASIFCLHNPNIKKDFFNKESPSGKLRFIIKNLYFWIEIAVIAVCCILFFALPPFSELVRGYLDWAGNKLFGFFILFPLLLVLDFFAYFSTVNWWSRQWKRKQTEKKRNPAVSLIIQLLPTMAGWIVGGYAMTVVVPAFVTLFAVIKVFLFLFLIILICLPVGVLAWIGYRSIYARRKLIKGARHIGKEKGFLVSVNGHPYRSVFYPDKGYHLLLRGDDLWIACRFVAAPRKRIPIYLHENGLLTCEKDQVIFKHYVSDQYFFDAEDEAKKVILICPCRSKIFIKSDSEEKLVDVGDRVMEYQVYNASGFLNAIERDCI